MAETFLRRQQATEDFDARMGYAGLKQQIEAERQKALQEMPASATGYAVSFMKRIEPLTKQFVSSLPKRLQPEFKARIGLDADAISTAAATRNSPRLSPPQAAMHRRNSATRRLHHTRPMSRRACPN